MKNPDEILYLSLYWGPRYEDLESSVQKILTSLQFLTNHHSIFSKWYKLGQTRKEALNKPIELKFDTLYKILLKRNNTMQGLGYRISLWNGLDSDQSVGLTINCGSTIQSLPNSLILSFPKLGTKRNELLLVNKSLNLMDSLVSIFKPKWGVITSEYQHSIALDRQKTNGPFMTYMTYIDTSIKVLPVLTPLIVVNQTGDYGTKLLIIDNETIIPKKDYKDIYLKVTTILQSIYKN